MQFIYWTHCTINYSISLSLTPKRLHVFISSYTLLKLLSRQNQHPLLTSFCSSWSILDRKSHERLMTTTVKYTRNFYTRDTFLYTTPFYNLEGIAIPSYDYPARQCIQCRGGAGLEGRQPKCLNCYGNQVWIAKKEEKSKTKSFILKNAAILGSQKIPECLS